MIPEIFSPLYQCAFKELVTKDLQKAQKKGADVDKSTDLIYEIYGDDLAQLTAEQLERLSDSINNEGKKYLFRERNRMNIIDFRKEVDGWE